MSLQEGILFSDNPSTDQGALSYYLSVSVREREIFMLSYKQTERTRMDPHRDRHGSAVVMAISKSSSYPEENTMNHQF